MKKKLFYIIYKYLFPAFLFVLGILNLMNYINASEFGILNLDVRSTQDQLVATRSGDLIKGDIVWGTFHSRFNNLGIVSVRFNNEDRDSADVLIFRLKERGQDRWYYEAQYNTDQFLPHRLFPFGFPTINNSDGIDYEFQLESVKGATGSGILIDRDYPVFIGKSTYTRADLEKDVILRRYFIANKLINVIGDPNLLYNIFLSLLPLLLFMVFLYTLGLSYQYLIIFTTALIVFDIFVVEKNYDLFLLGILFFWILLYLRFRFESAIPLAFSFIYLILTALSLLFGQGGMAEKSATWWYLFLIIAVIQYIYETIKKRPSSLTLRSFIINFSKFEITQNYWIRKIPDHLMRLLNSVLTIILFPISLISHELGFFLRTRFAKIIVQLIIISPAIILIVVPIKKAIGVYPKFFQFFPEHYIQRYVFSLVLPVLILLVLASTLFILIRKKIGFSNTSLIALLLMFNLFAGKIISSAISFEYRPTILSISPGQTNEAWTDVVISGKNFRDIPFVGKLYIGEIEQGEYMINWSDEKIVFRTSPELTQSGMVRVEPMDRKDSNMVPFEYTFKY